MTKKKSSHSSGRPSSMSPLASKIAEGLNNAIEFVEGRTDAGRTTFVSLPDPAPDYDRLEVQEVRKSCGLTQAMFARLMNVSVKNVEAWESGRKKPGPPARRLMQLVTEPEALKAAALLAGYRLVPVKVRGAEGRNMLPRKSEPRAKSKKRAKVAN